MLTKIEKYEMCNRLERHCPTKKCYNNIQLLDETEQNIVIYQWRADQLFADAEGRSK